MATSAAFEEAYKKLNAAQKKAVDTVEGPVLVIAGPGTGKTHILTLRIANILQKTQANASNILVLTFTESAARTVRTRLAALIGEETARDVFISTFHGFAEHVLQTYGDSFSLWAGKRLAGDVEATLLWREVLETEQLEYLRTPKSPYYYLSDLSRLRDDLVRERVSLDAYRAWAGEEAERVRADESLYYQRDSKFGKKGDAKPDLAKKLERYEKAREAARLIEAYEALKDARDVYDFTDVLAIVVDTLREDEALRAELAEQYQYVLADEHQDANAIQHAFLDALALDDHPNIFVVGDEKQAIYRFQGADAGQFEEFVRKYPRTEVVVLSESFRSYQEVLDVAHSTITATGEHRPLTATRTGGASLQVLAAPDPLAEREQVAELVAEAIAGGTPPQEIAVITRTNASANIFAEHLMARSVPTLRAGDVLLTARPILRALLALMRAVADPLDTAALREALLAPWWLVSLTDRARLMRTTRDSELLTALEQLNKEAANTIRGLQERALRDAPLELFSRLFAESGARGYLLSHADHLDDIVLVRKLMMHLEELVARNPERSFTEVIEELTKAHEHGLAVVKTSILQRDGFVSVITAHKAKGMEFERVFIVSATAREWEKGGRAPAIPSPIDSGKTTDDAVRLFYVAMTRAKNALTFSYALETNSGKEALPSTLIPPGLPQVAPSAPLLPLLHTNVDAPLLVRELTKQYLEHDGLSPSALNEYLDSPSCFFARRVLRLKEPETPALAIGTAVHAGIANYLEHRDEDQAYRELARCMRKSLLQRTAAYERVSEFARESLAAYIAQAGNVPKPLAIEESYKATRTFAGHDVLLTGQIDAIFAGDNGETIVDFKTTSQLKADDPDYVRQLAFYDLLLRENGRSPRAASIVQVTPKAVKDYPVPLTDETRAELLATLEAVVGELIAGTWREAPANEYDAVLALFKD